jgi:hypothetical protein
MKKPPEKMKNKSAQELVALRNKKYGKEWLVNNAKKANLASQEAKKKPKCVECGCTNEKACKGGCEWIEAPKYGGGKHWVCSKCV